MMIEGPQRLEVFPGFSNQCVEKFHEQMIGFSESPLRIMNDWISKGPSISEVISRFKKYMATYL